MEHLTLSIAVFCCILVFLLRPVAALGVYLAALVWYPNYMMVSMGTIDISLGRFVVTALLLRCLLDPRISSHRPKWCGLDTLVVLSMMAYTIPHFFIYPLSQAVENRAGFLMDSILAYGAVRFIITDYSKLVRIIKIASILLVPLAITGLIETVTGIRPFGVFLEHSTVFSYLSGYGSRWGFRRAFGPFSHSILFGCTFGLFLPLIYYLRNESGSWRYYAVILSLIAVAGAMSSMSSGPWVMLGVVFICLVMEKSKKWLKLILIFLVCSVFFVEIVSNRSFYHVLASYANPLGGSGWHRAKLIDLAIEHFDEWWLLGYKGEDPGWGRTLGMEKTDITNEFILTAVRYGIWGVIALCSVLTAAFRYLIRIHKKTANGPVKSLAWAFGTFLVTIIICWMSVSFFGQLISLFYCILGMVGSFYVFSKRNDFYAKPKVAKRVAGVNAREQENRV